MKSLFVFRPKWIDVLMFSIILGESTINCSFGHRSPTSHLGKAPLLEKFSWKILDWAYPDERSRRAAVRRGDLIPGNALPIGFEVWRNKLFLGVPRWKTGEWNPTKCSDKLQKNACIVLQEYQRLWITFLSTRITRDPQSWPLIRIGAKILPELVAERLPRCTGEIFNPP